MLSADASGEDAIYLRYDRERDRLFLRDDDSSAWSTGYSPGSARVIENSRARLYVEQCQVTASQDGKALHVMWALEFLVPAAGVHNQFLLAQRADGLYLGFDDLGDWTVDPCGTPTPEATPTATVQPTATSTPTPTATWTSIATPSQTITPWPSATPIWLPLLTK